MDKCDWDRRKRIGFFRVRKDWAVLSSRLCGTHVPPLRTHVPPLEAPKPVLSSRLWMNY